MTKEHIFAAFAHNIACVDGSLAEEEVKRIYMWASANNLEISAVTEALKKECIHPSNLKELADQMSDEDKDFAFFAAKRISMADGKIGTKELKKIHSFCELFGWGSQYATIEYIELLQANPSLLVEGVDF